MNLVQAIKFFQNSMVEHAKRLSAIELNSDEYYLRLRLISMSVEILEEIHEVQIGNTGLTYLNEKVGRYQILTDKLLTSL